MPEYRAPEPGEKITFRRPFDGYREGTAEFYDHRLARWAFKVAEGRRVYVPVDLLEAWCVLPTVPSDAEVIATMLADAARAQRRRGR
jgi:hypothetical protein